MKQLGQTTAQEVQAASLNPAGMERKRIPMNQDVQKFEVDPIPGYHLHWPLNNPARIARLMQAGYEFVKNDEVTVNGAAMGVSLDEGNMDLGDNVSVPSGAIATNGQAEMHVLMKIKEEWYQESEAIRETRNDGVAAALRGEAFANTPGDPSNRYIDKDRTKLPGMFTPKRR